MVHQRWEDLVFCISGAFAIASSLSSFFLIYKHLRNFTQPKEQKYIVRILLMVPIYSIDSWLSIRFREAAIYLDVVRDSYESYVLYCFFMLLVTYIEGEDEGSIVSILESKPPLKHPIPFCCLPSMNPGPWFYLVIKQLILQYVIVKPLLAIASVIMHITGVFGEGQFKPSKGYFYTAIFANISVTISVYCLVLFYLATKEELKPFSPISKFLCIKFVLFFSFWQSIFIAILAYSGAITEIGGWTKAEITTGFQDFLITIEMYILAVIHVFAFAYQPYRDPEKIPWRESKLTSGYIKPIFNNFKKVINQKDVASDVVDSFNPSKIRKVKESLKKNEEITDEEDITNVTIIKDDEKEKLIN